MTDDVLTKQQKRILSRFSEMLWAHNQQPNEATADYDRLIELGLLKRDPWVPTAYAVTDAGLAYNNAGSEPEAV